MANSSGLADSLPFVGAGIGAAQAVLGAIQAGKARKEVKGLVGQLKPLEIPGQITDILNLNLSNAQGDLQTQNYETQNLDNAFSSSLGSATRLGADPNDLSALFGQKINGILAIGEQTHQSRTAAFSSLIGALQNTADYNVARQVSINDIIKNKIQAANSNLATGTANLGSGVSNVLNSLSAAALAKLYKTNNGNTTTTVTNDFGTQLNDYLLNNSLKKQLAGSITAQDMQLSSIPNPNLNNYG